MKRRTFLQRGAVATAAAAALTAERASATGPVSSATLNRRGLYNGRGDTPRPLGAVGDLSPYVPSSERPWDARRAGHLLRRIGFGYSWDALQDALAKDPAQVVSEFLNPPEAPSPPGAWATQQPFPALTNDAVRTYYEWVAQMQRWWVDLMNDPRRMLQEKMTLFWHNHFVSETRVVYVAQYLYEQNRLFREFSFGDFRELTNRVTVDPAMLIYLDGAYNNQVSPNENYARELLELFTLGAGNYADGTPHYTEHDIVELSRALTGWTVQGLGSVFNPARFDNADKTIFGVTANFGVGATTSSDVINLIFEQVDPDHGRTRAAIYICSELYRWFVYDVPDMGIVEQMAATLENSNWQIGPVLEQLLRSEHFFDDNVVGAMIKSPADFVVGSMQQLKLDHQVEGTTTALTYPERHDPQTAMMQLAQWLFYHPSVQGWIGGRTWISSTTTPLRIRYSRYWVEPISGSLSYGFDPQAFIKSLPDSDSASSVLDHLLELLLPLEISQNTRDLLLVDLLGGGPAYEWDPDHPTAVPRIRACLLRLMSLGEFQLM